jgi:hypothetical protein
VRDLLGSMGRAELSNQALQLSVNLPPSGRSDIRS